MRVSLLAAALAAASLLVPSAATAALPPAEVSSDEALEVAERDPEVIEATREHPELRPSPSRDDGTGDWEVGFFSGDEQLVQVIVDDETGEARETWTGHQVAWTMARGYAGAFGRTLNAPYVWLPLCAIFLLCLVDWRRPFRAAHLDLLVIVGGFGLSHYFFNRGEIGLSVPLAYPPLIYLLGRMIWVGFRGGPALRPSVPVAYLAVIGLLLIGLRVGLNVLDSNVIDVGYSGVIGADRIADGEPLYGHFPDDNGSGDTYGTVAYYAYVPFEQVLPWSGSWDDLPAAHAAAIFFELGTLAGLFLLGRRLRPGSEGTALGLVLCFAWTACPYTAFALESNTNDALVSMLLVAALLVITSPAARGAALALATATKFAPIALAPLFATYDTARRAAGPVGGTAVTGPAHRVLSVIGPFAIAFAVTILLVSIQALLDPGLSTFWDRTIGNQAGRDSPFSVWGQAPSLGWLQSVVKVGAVALALLVAFRPRSRDPVTVAALGAAVLIALQLTIDHWFYLYLPWFLPFLFVALFARGRNQDLVDRAG